MVKDSIILTLYDREPVFMHNVVRGLCRNDLTDTEVVMVDDGSAPEYEEHYEDIKRFLHSAKIPVQYERMPEYEAYRIGGHNNPAKVNNRALELAKGERIFWLSSDVILQPHALTAARRFPAEDSLYVGQVLDMDTGRMFLGPERMFPMMWFVGCSRQHCLDIGGFDEEYLKGMAFEDNDFMGRLAIRTGRIVFDWSVLSYHQSHPQIAYSDDGAGFKLSAEYTKKKWHGVPFSGDKPVLSIKRGMNEKGVPEWTVGLQVTGAPVCELFAEVAK